MAGVVGEMLRRWKAEWTMGCVYKASLIATNVQLQPAQRSALPLREPHHLLLTNPTCHQANLIAKMLLSPEELAQSSIPLPEVVEVRQVTPFRRTTQLTPHSSQQQTQHLPQTGTTSKQSDP
jgi:hypothetical protein